MATYPAWINIESSQANEQPPMSSPVPICRTVTVFTFRGDRSRPFTSTFLNAINDARNGIGPGPTHLDCLFYAGHTGVSIDEGTTVYGFNPQNAGLPAWQILDRLQNGEAFPAVVTDDGVVFTTAQQHGLTLRTFEVILPDPRFQDFQTMLDAERVSSQYSYGFPDGDGDCNCTTWLERLGLPLLTGLMSEFVGLPGISSFPRRRFGRCV
jgi:hypothetical protein